MGFLKKLFGQENKATNTDIGKELTVVQPKLIIHPDILDLIWVADGLRKNYTSKIENNFFEYNGIRIAFSFSVDEPSLISLKLPIHNDVDISMVESPPYFPTYANLTAEQKGVYWKFLAEPYSGKYNVGYVFLLYYGLERHLIEGKFEEAFHIILKLRDVYNNKSFQTYSACALILTCLLRKRADLILEFIQSLDNDYEFCFSPNLYLLCKMGLDISLTSKDIMRMAKTFEFNNLNYIKKYPDIFEKKLEEEMQKKLSSTNLRIGDYVSQNEFKKLRKEAIIIFANLSLKEKNIDVPLLSESFKLKKIANELLECAHNSVKQEVALMRKEGTIISNDKVKEIKPELSFDEKRENELLLQYKKAKSNIMELHFVLISLEDFYYSYRTLGDCYINKCITYCTEDISLLPELQKQYRITETARYKQLAKYDKSYEGLKEEYFNGNITAYKRLAIIYEKNKDFQNAINICNEATNYYKAIGEKEVASEFEERKDKINQKCQ